MPCRLNRTMSPSIRRNAGRTRLRRWAKTVSNEVPFHSRPLDLVAHAEAHVAGLGGDAEVGEEGDEPRVVPLVVDEEAGVDVEGAVGEVDPDGVGVAARPVVGLEQRDVV